VQEERLNTPSPAAPSLASCADRWVSPELSVVVATLNECENVPLLLRDLTAALKGLNWEVIFVDDDSPDGTSRKLREIARLDPRVRCLRRIARRGLAGACIEGMLASSALAVAVMDGDLQHDESLLTSMFQAITEGADLVVASRMIEGGTVGKGLSALRNWGSRLANTAAQQLIGVRLSDPMSGFFMMRRDKFDALAARLSTQGFKILLDIVASSSGRLNVVELPYRFRPRQHGSSKLDGLVVLQYAGLLLAKLSGDRISIRFVLFALVGASGLFVHVLALKGMLSLFNVGFTVAQTLAAYVAMTWNFFMNNQLTYRDQRLKGLAALAGLLSFYAVCSVGAIANVGVASWIYNGLPRWWLAGTAGALMGAVFNYATSSVFTWRGR
jgi:dolichol-phosphate mannosyltransferase